MATQLDDDQDWTEDAPDLDLDADDAGEADEGADGQDAADADAEKQDDDDQDVIEYAGAALDRGEDEPEGVRSLRAELKRERAARKEAERRAGGGESDVGEKPTLEGCDYDEDRYDRERDAWKERKRQADEAADEQEQLGRAVSDDIAEAHRAYEQQRSGLRLAGYDAANDRVTAALPDVILNALNIAAGGKAAAVRFYLGTHEDELAKIKALNPKKATDWFRAAGMIGAMAEKINVSRKPTTTPVERRPGATGGSSSGTRSLDTALARASKTGNVNDIMREMRRTQEKK